MNDSTFSAIKSVCEARSNLLELCVFFEDLTKDEDLPSRIRESSENALYELIDRFSDIDMCMRYFISLDLDLQPRPYKEF